MTDKITREDVMGDKLKVTFLYADDGGDSVRTAFMRGHVSQRAFNSGRGVIEYGFGDTPPKHLYATVDDTKDPAQWKFKKWPPGMAVTAVDLYDFKTD